MVVSFLKELVPWMGAQFTCEYQTRQNGHFHFYDMPALFGDSLASFHELLPHQILPHLH